MGNKGYNTSSSDSTSQNIYSHTSTKNPYVTSTTHMGGTKTQYVPNTAIAYVDKYMGKNIGSLINDYLNPSLDSEQNQYLLNNYKRNLSKEASQMLNNQIISPLADRNMIRSSQATNMYNNLANSLNEKLADYQAALYENAQNQASDKLKTLYDMYMNGYNVISGNQAQSLQTSAGGGTQSGTSDTKSFGL